MEEQLAAHGDAKEKAKAREEHIATVKKLDEIEERWVALQDEQEKEVAAGAQ